MIMCCKLLVNACAYNPQGLTGIPVGRCAQFKQLTNYHFNHSQTLLKFVAPLCQTLGVKTIEGDDNTNRSRKFLHFLSPVLLCFRFLKFLLRNPLQLFFVYCNFQISQLLTHHFVHLKTDAFVCINIKSSTASRH